MFGKGLNRKSWFEQLVGFKEENREQVRQNLIIEDNFIHSKVNGETYDFGKLEIISLQELKRIISLNQNYNSQITIAELVANVQELHTDSSNKNAVFQAASQFNLLEMISPNVTPDNGITNYENDHT
jgi:hypothetical protein